jgi:hypothetical protein
MDRGHQTVQDDHQVGAERETPHLAPKDDDSPQESRYELEFMGGFPLSQGVLSSFCSLFVVA